MLDVEAGVLMSSLWCWLVVVVPVHMCEVRVSSFLHRILGLNSGQQICVACSFLLLSFLALFLFVCFVLRQSLLTFNS